MDSRIGVEGEEMELVGETVLREREADLVVGMSGSVLAPDNRVLGMSVSTSPAVVRCR